MRVKVYPKCWLTYMIVLKNMMNFAVHEYNEEQTFFLYLELYYYW